MCIYMGNDNTIIQSRPVMELQHEFYGHVHVHALANSKP